MMASNNYRNIWLVYFSTAQNNAVENETPNLNKVGGSVKKWEFEMQPKLKL